MPPQEHEHIGSLIRARVNELPELSSRQLAEKLGVHEQTIYDIYKRPSINTDILLKLCRILQVPVSYFLEEPSTPEPEPLERLAAEAESEQRRASDTAPTSLRAALEAAEHETARHPQRSKSLKTSGRQDDPPRPFADGEGRMRRKSDTEAQSLSTEADPGYDLFSTPDEGHTAGRLQYGASKPGAGTPTRLSTMPNPPEEKSYPRESSDSVRELRELQTRYSLELAQEKVQMLESQLRDKEMIIQLLLEKIRKLKQA